MLTFIPDLSRQDTCYIKINVVIITTTGRLVRSYDV